MPCSVCQIPNERSRSYGERPAQPQAENRERLRRAEQPPQPRQPHGTGKAGGTPQRAAHRPAPRAARQTPADNPADQSAKGRLPPRQPQKAAARNAGRANPPAQPPPRTGDSGCVGRIGRGRIRVRQSAVQGHDFPCREFRPHHPGRHRHLHGRGAGQRPRH